MENIWNWTAANYSVEQAERYQTLLNSAIEDIRTDPTRPTSKAHPELGTEIRSYKIALSKGGSPVRVGSPRHVVFYTTRFQDVVVVLRILHDRMNPADYL